MHDHDGEMEGIDGNHGILQLLIPRHDGLLHFMEFLVNLANTDQKKIHKQRKKMKLL